MSFSFKWPRFSDQFHADAIQMLDAALNKGNKPPVIADRIEVVELEMGTEPPELEIRDVGELTMDQFRGIFRLSYAGDAHIVLRTKVQANPLNHKQPDIHLMSGSRGMLAAKHPLVVPMLLRLSHFRLNSIVILVVSKQKGITLVFKTDPLQNVDIHSTFDSIAVIQKFIQNEIEGQLRQMFREDLPSIIHRLSQQWVKAKVEAPYLNKRAPISRARTEVGGASAPSYRLPPRMPASGFQPPFMRAHTSASVSGFGRDRSSSVMSASSMGRRAVSTTSSPAAEEKAAVPEGPTSFPDIEHFDPTYGLRPEGLPTKSVFGNFKSLFTPNKGLADLAEEPDMDDNDMSFDMASWDEFLSESRYSAPPPSVSDLDDVEEYESVPAVGGGTITRPRVVHAQSQVQIQPGEPSRSQSIPSLSHRRPLSHYSTMSQSYESMPPRRPPFSRPSATDRPLSTRAGSSYNPYFAGATPLYGNFPPELDYDTDRPPYQSTYDSRHSSVPSAPMPPLDATLPRRPSSPSSVRTQPSRSSDKTHSVPTPPSGDNDDLGIRINRPRRLSIGSLNNMDRFYTGSPPEGHHIPEHDPKIVLKPAVNNSVSRLSTLSHSYHTLSPYTRTLEHFTVRSVPPRDVNSPGSNLAGAGAQPVKAKRKRTHRLGGKQTEDPSAAGREGAAGDTSEPQSPAAPLSEFDASDMDRYFRARDDLVPQYPDLHPSHVRRRFAYQRSDMF